jgi:deoxyadenosine/deoxycytidine kinase
MAKLREHYKGNENVVFIDEPVDEWMAMKDSADGKNILQKYYENQEKYGFSFQIFAYITKLRKLHDAFELHESNPNVVLISERSLYTDRYVFAKMLYTAGKIEEINYSIYLNWFDYFINKMSSSQSYGIIYVDTSPQKCFERIQKRSRKGEGMIELEYLQNCNKYHHEMIHEELKNITTCVLNGNIDLPDTSPASSDATNFIDTLTTH